jgi:uncharacterized membrane protein YccF (DUF307 family)
MEHPKPGYTHMRTLGNILWFFPLGLLSGISWYLAGLFLCLTIVGIPWARSCFSIGSFSFRPFGRDVISRKGLSGKDDLGTGALGILGNIIWFLVAGWWLALIHLSAAIICAVTIIGIPFAIQHLKLAAISLSPIGKTVVKKHLAEAARMSAAHEELKKIRGVDANSTDSQLPTPPSLGAPKFHVARGQETLGEFEKSEILKNLAAGLMQPSDWFWDSADNEWKPLASLP